MTLHGHQGLHDQKLHPKVETTDAHQTPGQCHKLCTN